MSHKKAISFLLWYGFPPLFYYHTKKEGVIKHWWTRSLLTLIAPCSLFVYLMILLLIATIQITERNETYEPAGTSYHNAYDLQMATGVEFPAVIPVDSISHDDFCNTYIRVKFVPKKRLTKSFFKCLDRACKTDTLCWKKDGDAYVYIIYPNRPLDRTNKSVSPYRMVDFDNDGIKEQYDWDGDYVMVKVPFKGDTITVEDGWVR